MNATELAEEARRLSALLDAALNYLKAQTKEYAQADHDYAQAKSLAYPQTSGTVDERRAEVDRRTLKERHRVHLAEGMKQAALEAVRSRRAQLSALQTQANAFIEEAKWGRTGPDV